MLRRGDHKGEFVVGELFQGISEATGRVSWPHRGWNCCYQVSSADLGASKKEKRLEVSPPWLGCHPSSLLSQVADVLQ